MEALRKAEEQKRKAQESGQSDAQSAGPGESGPVSSDAAGNAPSSPVASAGEDSATPAGAPEENLSSAAPASASDSVVPPWFGRGGQSRKSRIPDVELTLEEIPTPSATPVPADGGAEATASSTTGSEAAPASPSSGTEPNPPPAIAPEVPLPKAEPALSTSAGATVAPAEKKARTAAIPRQPRRPTRSEAARESGAGNVNNEAARRQSARSVFNAKTGNPRQARNRRIAVLGSAGVVVTGGLAAYLLFNMNSGGISVNLDNFDPAQQLPPMETAQAGSATEFSSGAAAVAFVPDAPPADLLDNGPLTADLPGDFPPGPLTAGNGGDVSAQVAVPVAEIVEVPPQLPQPQAAAPLTPLGADPVPVAGLGPVDPEEPVATAAPPGTPPEDSAVTTAQTAAAMAVDPGPPDAPVAAQPQQSVMLVRRADRPSLDPVLVSAYAAYQNGDLAGAVRLYEQVLAEVPLNRDALMGLATIARRDGDATRARELYSRLLTRDPRDPAARAGLLELAGGNPVAQERELKRLLSVHPGEPTLSFALGNLYAAQQRWPEAQQQYFDALQQARSSMPALGGINPDYAFNLAVSLEHMNQMQPAITYYREALALSDSHPAGFDLQLVRNKLQQATQE